MRSNSSPTTVLFILVCLALFTGCDRGAEEAREEEEKRREAQEDARGRDEVSERERLDAFGLPLPPRVLRIKRWPDRIKVNTDMTMVELKTFYDKHLIDYEVIATGNSLQAIPLRAYMPSIIGSRPFGSRHPKELIYMRPKKAPEAIAVIDEGAKQGAAQKGTPSTRDTSSPRPSPLDTRRGMPVTTKTPEGKLLAPGARWGEPYTPPAGSPLDNPRWKANFGRPYGRWIPD